MCSLCGGCQALCLCFLRPTITSLEFFRSPPEAAITNLNRRPALNRKDVRYKVTIVHQRRKRRKDTLAAAAVVAVTDSSVLGAALCIARIVKRYDWTLGCGHKTGKPFVYGDHVHDTVGDNLHREDCTVCCQPLLCVASLYWVLPVRTMGSMMSGTLMMLKSINAGKAVAAVSL